MTARTLVLAAFLMAAGCAAPLPPISTPSGQPEVTILADKRAVMDTLVNESITGGFRIHQQTEHLLVVGKDATSFGELFAYGSEYNNTPERRINFNVVETANGVRVVAQIYYVTNPNSAFEKRHPPAGPTRQVSRNALAALRKLKEQVEADQLAPPAGDPADMAAQ